MNALVKAIKMVREAGTEWPRNWKEQGWTRTTECIDKEEAEREVLEALGDPDYEVEVVRTCAGFIVIQRLR